MKKISVTVVFFLALIISGVAGAQDDYVVGPRDEFTIQVQGEPEMTQPVTVSAAGTITYWYLGEIPVEGMTILQIKQHLSKVLAEGYLRNPVVEVILTSYRSKEVQIQGAISRPGTYSLETNSITVLKLISMAGGCKDDRGHLAYILRGKVTEQYDVSSLDVEDIAKIENRIVVDLNKLLVQGDTNEDKDLYGGDFVLVSSNTAVDTAAMIWIEGQVAKPGSYPYQPGLTALQACLKAGGFTDVAAENRATISRKSEEGESEMIKLKLKDISKNKRPDVPLQPGDRITIPESHF